jgi:hypothetical protein
MSTKDRFCFSTNAFASGSLAYEYHSLGFSSLGYSPASLVMPSLEATTHEASQKAHTRRSLPSLVHPHLAAATASISGGLFAYVDSLNVARRARKEATDDGRYSEFACRASILGRDR